MILMSVDFPAPFSPSSAWTSPGSKARDTSSRAWVEPNRLLTPWISRTGGRSEIPPDVPMPPPGSGRPGTWPVASPILLGALHRQIEDDHRSLAGAELREVAGGAVGCAGQVTRVADTPITTIAAAATADRDGAIPLRQDSQPRTNNGVVATMVCTVTGLPV